LNCGVCGRQVIFFKLEIFIRCVKWIKPSKRSVALGRIYPGLPTAVGYLTLYKDVPAVDKIGRKAFKIFHTKVDCTIPYIV
jgi:hypothetical protein